MEDLDALWDGTIEEDFMDLIKHNHSKSLFVLNVQIMLGDGWEETGKDILETYDKGLLKKFNSYIGE